MGSTQRTVARNGPLRINIEKRGLEMVNGEITEEDVPLSPAARLFHQPHFNCYIIAMMGSGKRIDVDAVKAGLEVTIVRHPRFSSILVSHKCKGKNPRWVRTKVAIDNHIIIPNLNPPQTTTPSPSSPPDQLIEDYVASLSTTTLDLSRPLWDLHILNIRTAEAEAVAVLRIHHSLGDGISLMSLLLACTRKTSDPDSLPSLPESRRRKSAESARGGRVWALLVRAWALLVLVWHTLVDVVLFVATAAFLSDTETPLKGEEGVEFHPKRFLHRTLSLDDIKIIKNAVGCTINEVLVGVTTATLSRYLNRRYGETADRKKRKENSLQAKIRLRTTILVNIRPTPGIHALAEMMEGRGGARWGNWFGYIIVRFPIVTYEDPLDYLRKGMEIAKRKKNSLEAICTYIGGSLFVKILGIKAAAALCYRVIRHTTVSLSNIVGPVEEIGFFGHPMVYLAPSVYGHPQAVTLHFQSYMNKMKIVLAVDELAVPDPHQLLDYLAESLQRMKDAVVTRSS